MYIKRGCYPCLWVSTTDCTLEYTLRGFFQKVTLILRHTTEILIQLVKLGCPEARIFVFSEATQVILMPTRVKNHFPGL